MESLLPFLKMFATPMGSFINKSIASGAAAVIAYSAAKGNPLGDVTGVVSSLALAASYGISALASTQGVKIAVLNSDTTNGVKVVRSDANAPAVDGVVKRGGPHG